MQTVAVCLPASAIHKIENYVQSGFYQSLSEAIRYAVWDLIQFHESKAKLTEEIQEVLADFGLLDAEVNRV